MTNTSLEAYIGLLIQVPLVGIFVWFALALIKQFQQSLEKRAAQWQQFFEEQRQAYHDAVAAMAARFGDKIKGLSKEISEMRGMLKK